MVFILSPFYIGTFVFSISFNQQISENLLQNKTYVYQFINNLWFYIFVDIQNTKPYFNGYANLAMIES